jgi:hypothetical protein
MDTPGRTQTAAQIAAKNRLRAAHIALNNGLSHRDTGVSASALTAGLTELSGAQAQYRTAFTAELAANPNLGAGI